MDTESQTKRRRLIVSGVVLVALGALVVVMVRFRGHFPLDGLATPAAGPPVLLITIDTLRADHLGCYGYQEVETPAIDFLAAQGARFDDALAQVPMTPPSHMVILSGTYPMWNGVRDFHPTRARKGTSLLAEAFARHGYATAAFISSFVLNSSWGMNQGFETYDAEFPEAESASVENPRIERSAGETIDLALSWFQSHDPRGRRAKPFFVWIHLYDPHGPYDPPEPFHTQYAGHLYDGEIAYADSQLGRLFDYLRQIGFYDRTLIVLLSDHGESLGEHGEETHGYFVYRSTMRVPLIIKPARFTSSGGEARVVNTLVGTVDVAPTVVELAHLQDPISRQFQGNSLVSLVLGKGVARESPVYSECYQPLTTFGWSPLRSISTDRYHYVEAPQPELYDLAQDPAETHNVYGQRRADAATLRDLLLSVERRYTDPTASSRKEELSTETVEKLKSLGYVALTAPQGAGSQTDLADPKDKLPIYVNYEHAQALWYDGQHEKSDALLQTLLAKEPRLIAILLELGSHAFKQRRWADAERDYQACLRIDPTLGQAIMAMAMVTNAEGRSDESRKWLELEVSRKPTNSSPYYWLGELARSASNLGEAQRNYEKSVALDPGFAPAQEALGTLLFDAERYGEAVKPLEAAVSLGAHDAQLFNDLATAYFHTHQPTKALGVARKALALRRDPAAARLDHAMGELADGNRQNALSEFRALCTDDPADCLQYEKFFQ